MNNDNKQATPPAMNTASPTEIPAGIYYSKLLDNFYDMESECGKGADFHGKWYERRTEFPDESSGSGAAPVGQGSAPSACPACQGNDGGMPCAYPSEGKAGCWRDVRLGQGSAASGEAAPLPPLPTKCYEFTSPKTGWFTANQMFAYARAALAASAEQSNTPLYEYGDTDFGFTCAGIQLEAGDKRLASLIVHALGTAHPAMDDLIALLFRARPAPVAERAATIEKPFAGPGKWFSVNVLGGPMREYAPGQWENAAWPSDAERAAAPASVPEGYKLVPKVLRQPMDEAMDSAKQIGNSNQHLWDCALAAAPEVAQPAAQSEESARLRKALTEVRNSLQFANDSPGGGICDTIWMMERPETMFDFIDSVLATPAPTAGEPSGQKGGA